MLNRLAHLFVLTSIAMTTLATTMVTTAAEPMQVPSLHRTGWNLYATRFMYPPTFEVEPFAAATNYRVTVQSKDGQWRCVGSSKQPHIDLAGQWEKLPPTLDCQAWIEALDSSGQIMARSEMFGFCKVATFGATPYRQATRDYRAAGEMGAEYILNLLKNPSAAPAGARGVDLYPSLFRGPYIEVLLDYAKGQPQSAKTDEAIAMAKQVAQGLIKMSTPADWKYPNMPLTHTLDGPLQVARTGMVGTAYIHLFEATNDQQFLDAAIKIADALKTNQSTDGRWPFRVNPKTGVMLEDYTSDQVEPLEMLDLLIEKHGQKQFTQTRDRALNWLLENPVKTHRWENQYEDGAGMLPYHDLEFLDTAIFTRYLIERATPANGYRAIAEDLFRYAEDQFVLWENSYNPTFITPGVQEQYVCYITIDAHSANFIFMCIAMHKATGDPIYLNKARALADTLTAIQSPKGYLPTWLRQSPANPDPLTLNAVDGSDFWPDCCAFSSRGLLELGDYLQQHGNSK